MNKNLKIGLGIVGIALLIRIIAQKGGFLGTTIGNKGADLQNLYKTLSGKGLKPKVSGLLDTQDFIEYDFNSPFGVQNTRFYADGTLVLTKQKSGEIIKGKWFPSGEIIVENYGSINEGSLEKSSLALNSVVV
jgi:hypothetical protein